VHNQLPEDREHHARAQEQYGKTQIVYSPLYVENSKEDVLLVGGMDGVLEYKLENKTAPNK